MTGMIDPFRPLVITDCDEVLLRMVSHFRDWLAEAHAIRMDLTGGFSGGLHRSRDGERIPDGEIWELLGGFFDAEMHRQDPVPGAIEAIHALTAVAEVVVLTNLMDFRRDDRVRQLAALGLDLPVYTNQGPKGPALQRIVEERGRRSDGSTRTVFFIDDLAVHHDSVAETVPHVIRLHLVGEPEIASHVPCAFETGSAHARIDDWQRALPWLLARIEEYSH